MFGIVKFFLVVAFVVCGLGFASIIWPKLTRAPRPTLLAKMYDLSKNTSAGRQTADVLGVSDAKVNQPINLGDLANQAANLAVSTVETKTREIIARQAILQLVSQIDKLNPDEKQQIKDLLCQPVATKSAGN